MHFKKKQERVRSREREVWRKRYARIFPDNIKTQDEITRKELQVSPTSATSFRSRRKCWMDVHPVTPPLCFLAALVSNSFLTQFCVPVLRAHLYYYIARVEGGGGAGGVPRLGSTPNDNWPK